MLPWLSTASSTDHFDYSYAHIYHLIIEDFVVEIHHGPSLTVFLFYLMFYRSYIFYTRYFSFLN